MYFLLKLLPFLALVFGSNMTNPFDPIINGRVESISSYPYYAFLSYHSTSLRCGGAIIKTNMVLTAAHCITDGNIKVYTGIQSLSDLQYSQPYYVRYLAKYPRYQGQSGYDIGLLILASHIRLGPTVKTISIPTVIPRVGSAVTVIGFGPVSCPDSNRHCQSGQSHILRSAAVKVVSNRNQVILTIGSNTNSVCYGDSGSPVVSGNYLVGLVSSIEHKNCSGHNFHVAVAYFYRWIKRYMAAY
ncbi:putative granzyme [Trypoxylus dichotomus]